jgi:polyhydroxyalkanoate synthesis regulator phasin
MVKDARDTQTARCLNCRGEVQVPNTFADGDTIECGTCGVSLKVQRAGGGLRLVIADVTPLRDEMRSTQQRIRALESDLSRARASFGIGANGLGLGLLYVIAQVGLEEKQISAELIRTAVAVAAASGIGLELANYLFLAKRREMSRLSGEIAQLQSEVNQIQSKIRESGTVRSRR